MTKAELVSRISERTGIDKSTALEVVENFMEQVRNSLIEGESVYLRGFGTFLLKQRAEKTARNISTLIVPAHKIPAFKPSKSFSAQVK